VMAERSVRGDFGVGLTEDQILTLIKSEDRVRKGGADGSMGWYNRTVSTENEAFDVP